MYNIYINNQDIIRIMAGSWGIIWIIAAVLHDIIRIMAGSWGIIWIIAVILDTIRIMAGSQNIILIMNWILKSHLPFQLRSNMERTTNSNTTVIYT